MTDYALTKDGELYGDDFLSELWNAGFAVKRFGDQAGLEAKDGQGGIPDFPLMWRFALAQKNLSIAICDPATALRGRVKRGKKRLRN